MVKEIKKTTKKRVLVSRVKDKKITNVNGVTPLRMARLRKEFITNDHQDNQSKAEKEEFIEKKSFNVNKETLDSILKSIKDRLVNAEVKESKDDSVLINESESLSQPSIRIPLPKSRLREINGIYVRKGDYASYHKAMQKTKTDRMLTQFEKYNKLW